MSRSTSVYVVHFFAIGLGGVSIGIGSVVNAFFNGLSSWITKGAADMLVALGTIVTTSSNPTLQNGFSTELDVVAKIGAELSVPFLGLAVLSAIVHQDVGLLLRAVFIRLPLSLLMGAACVELVSLALGATNAMSAAVLDSAGGSVDSMLTGIVSSISVPGVNAGLGAFAVAFLAFAATVAAFVLWVELVIRGAAISVAVLFLPIALAGVIWPATAHWAKRLGETIAALVFSKLVIAAVLALGAISIVHGSGPSGAVEGIAMLLLAVLAPFSLLRLLPAIETGAVAHFEAMSHRALRGARDAGASAGGVVGNQGVDQMTPPSGVPMLQGTPVDPDVIDDLARGVQAHIDARRAAPATSAPDSSTAGSVVTPTAHFDNEDTTSLADDLDE